MCGRQAWITRQFPTTFTFSWAASASGSMWRSAPATATPAFEISTSIPPASSTTAATASATCAASVMSHTWWSASAPHCAAAPGSASASRSSSAIAVRGGEAPCDLEADAVRGAGDDGDGAGHGETAATFGAVLPGPCLGRPGTRCPGRECGALRGSGRSRASRRPPGPPRTRSAPARGAGTATKKTPIRPMSIFTALLTASSMARAYRSRWPPGGPPGGYPRPRESSRRPRLRPPRHEAQPGGRPRRRAPRRASPWRAARCSRSGPAPA